MKSGKLKRNFWLTAEIECMLNLIKEVKCTQGSTQTTTHHTFTQIASKMKKHGFPNKSPTQVRRKWFQMKSAYLCYKKGNIDRLFLIPEKFRTVIAQFVENNKMRRIASITSTQNQMKSKRNIKTHGKRHIHLKFLHISIYFY
ncbi:CG5727 [Drosophila busckii]|uniref:CG5727 n=1 Tax=Drosophila busckii TaxID=30019 RepID=A0A0M4EQD5_DROBS|nr:CG5727 [Drosophila busckii]